MDPLCSSLSHGRLTGIRHDDLRSNNVFMKLDRNGAHYNVLIGDFGLSCCFKTQQECKKMNILQCRDSLGAARDVSGAGIILLDLVHRPTGLAARKRQESACRPPSPPPADPEELKVTK